MHAAQKAVQNSQSDKSISAFSSTHRLLRKDRFDHVFGGGNVSDKYFKVFFADNGGENARLGIIASKRSFPRAVDRNRVKRMVRESFRRHGIKLLKLDLVVLAKTAVINDDGAAPEKLNAMLGLIEKRCAKS